MTTLAMVMCGVVAGCGPGAVRVPPVDEVLHRAAWRQGTLGSTGERLFTERIEEGLGFRGQFCYIHHADIRDPIRLEFHRPGGPSPVQVRGVDWYPSHLVVRARVGQCAIVERKFITDDDVLVDLVELKNVSDVPSEDALRVTSGFAMARGAGATLTGSDDFYGVRGHGVVAGDGFVADEQDAILSRQVRLQPGESLSFTLAFAMDEDPEAAQRKAKAWIDRPDALEHHRKTYQSWFEANCPQFECDDPYVSKLWWYRWFVARHCLSRARTGGLPEPYFFEGTHQPHFPRMIAFSSPHIINETRWLRDSRYAFGQVRNHAANPDPEHGFFISARINKADGEYNNWIVQSAWGAFQVHPDEAFLEETIDALATDVRGTFARFDTDGDKLCTPRNHWTTGMEFQPAFFFFNDYDDTKPEAPLERGDFVAYTHGNALALAEAYDHLGRREEAREFARLAREIRDACLAKMWHEQDRFVYAIREGDDAVARCREVVGFYPFATRLLPDEKKYTSMLRYLVDPEEFWTAFPPATVTKKCPAYTPKVAHWPAAGGRTHGCMWNGPAWPHATSYMLDVTASAIRHYDQPHVTPEHFWHMLDRYTHLQFDRDDLNRPMVTEYYNGQTGEPDPRGCADYFHSTYCDLIIRHVVGLQPANSDKLTINPIPGPLKRFALRRLRYRNHDLDVTYNGTGNPAYGPAGLTVYVDGRRAAHRDDLGELKIRLPN